MKNKNLKVIITIGISCSGKSTWSKNFIKNNQKYIRVSRDDIRSDFFGRVGILSVKEEDMVTQMVDKVIIEALRFKYNVIVDNTHLKQRVITHIIELVKGKADVEFKTFTIDMKDALKRNEFREENLRISKDSLKEQQKKLTDLYENKFDFSFIPMETLIIDNITLDKTDLPSCVIFDIDGTLAHNNGKRSYFDWESVDSDDLDQIVRDLLYSYQDKGYKIIIMSGREEYSREKTEFWLDMYDITYDELILKEKNDYRKDTIVKKELYKNHIEGKYNPLVVFDDREGVVKMWRSLGLRCFQVLEGNF